MGGTEIFTKNVTQVVLNILKLKLILLLGAYLNTQNITTFQITKGKLTIEFSQLVRIQKYVTGMENVIVKLTL